MAQRICEYCGRYVLDTEQKCSHCGAVNNYYKRTTSDTPKTIEELKDWYKARNLPPESVTRFFIGKDIREPRAFGIYEENGIFIVYKNKSDGSRAVRYEGRDEAYAVNELYLRLKEEILNQKNRNLDKRSPKKNPPAKTAKPTYRYNQNKSRPKKNSSMIKKLIKIILFIYILQIVLTISMMGFMTYLLRETPEDKYYISNSEEIYYNNGYINGQYEWWKYNYELQDWEFFNGYNKEKEAPQGIDIEESYSSDNDVETTLDLSYDISIEHSKAFIDAGNHFNPEMGYYYYDNQLYYFLNDTYSNYGNHDNTGWYKYITENDEWEYYCDVNDKETLGEDLWYSDYEYNTGKYISSVYDFTENQSVWSYTDFDDTDWYASYESNKDAYYDDINSSSNNSSSNDYSNDSDWDWDNDSWSSNDTDWDSDW